ncbi:helix-turn-helix domain-containing protein [Bifidobacterium animalis]|uniref:helix-turn-helix domain-containing protein n=1 Tax=Bifidobacterium animalis TaxID=28025 RepID=UPI003F902AB0
MGTRAYSADDDFSRAVTARIDQAIRDAGISKADLIKKTGLSHNYVYKRLRGEGPWTTHDIDLISRALDIEPLTLMAGAAKTADSGMKADSEKQATQRVSEILRNLSDTFALAADDEPYRDAEGTTVEQ